MAFVSNVPPFGGARSSHPGFRYAALRVAQATLLATPAMALVAAGIDHRWMDDDGFINLRVVRNLLEGHGPVFNVGERVEAVTSPLWIALLTPFGAAGIRLEDSAVYLGIALAGLGVWLAAQAAARLHAPGAPSPAAALSIPFGAALYAALPPAWDYASAGLEVGLGLAWLGVAFRASARAATGGYEDASGRRRLLVDALLVGLAPLVRPDLALHAFVPLLLLAAAAWRSAPARRGAARAALCIGAAAAIPLAYQVFRMGYYGSAAPNTALAKEAALTNVTQGVCYFDNFAGTYRLAWPFGVAAVAWVGVLVRSLRARRGLAFAALAAPPWVAALHAAYVVRVGGDYMHGRMLLLPAFAALLPVASLPLRPKGGWIPLAGTAILFVAALPWVGLCTTRLRMGADNVCDVGEERGWYARSANVDRPVRLDDYRDHPFYGDGVAASKRVLEACPTLSSKRGLGSAPGCRLLHLSDDERAASATAASSVPLSDDVDPRIAAVISAGAIGMVGVMLPDSVHIVDRLGLADPLTARRLLDVRGRPGHEKTLPAAWTIARFAKPSPHEDGAVAAARRALACGPLASLERAVTGRLDLTLFVDNVARALGRAHLRIPADPFEAERTYCGTPPLETTRARGGAGGAAFHVRCPDGARVVGVRGHYAQSDHAVSGVEPVCSAPGTGPFDGATAGDGAGDAFELACPGGGPIEGLRVGADNLVRALGLVCRGDGGGAETAFAGTSDLPRGAVACRRGRAVVGFIGRSGALVDAIGVECAQEDAARPKAP